MSGIRLPRGDGMKTKTPLLMRMRKAETVSMRIGTSPDKMVEVALEDVEAVIDRLTAELTGASASGDDEALPHGGLVDKPLYLEVRGPAQLNLTLIDLPGIFFLDKDGNECPETLAFIKAMYAKHINSPACVIVVVMTATEDSATQLARGIAKEADPAGIRTIGVLTKVDRCTDGMEDVVRRMKGEGANGLRFKLGAVALRNPKDDTPASRTREAADAEEARFFTSHPLLCTLDTELWGLSTLASKLAQVQLERYSASVPGLRLQIEARLAEAEKELKSLPEMPATAGEAQRLYLRRVYGFMGLIGEVKDLRYDQLERLVAPSATAAAAAAAGDETAGAGAVGAVSTLAAAAEASSSADASFHFMPRLMELCEKFRGDVDAVARPLLNSTFHAHVKAKYRERRGKSLDDVHIPAVFDDLLREEVALLKAPVMKLLNGVHTLMRGAAVKLAKLHFRSSERLSNAISSVLEAMLLHSKHECAERLDELLLQEATPFTVNHYYAETLAKLQGDEYRAAWLSKACREGGIFTEAHAVDPDDDESVAAWALSLDPEDESSAHTPPCPELGSNEQEAIVALQLRLYSYRKVVQKRFVDQVGGLLRLKFPLRLAEEGARILESSIRLSSEAPNTSASSTGSSAGAGAGSAAAKTSVGGGPVTGPLMHAGIPIRPSFNLEDVMSPSPALRMKRTQLEASVERLTAALKLLDECA